jgi:DNA-binding NarL/FixJ family response regulator
MDFTTLVNHVEPNQRMVRSWIASSDMRLSFVLAFTSRLSLLGMISTFKQRKRLVGVASDEETALHYVKLCRPGMLLCGDQLEEGDGYSLVARARKLVPDLRVVMILNEACPDVERAIALKVEMICLDREVMRPERPVAFGLLAAVQGKHFVSPLAQESLKRVLTAEETDATSILTPTENKVMELMIRGLSDRDIANLLHLSIHTVRDYNKSIRNKFGVKSKLQLAAMMLRTSIGLSA